MSCFKAFFALFVVHLMVLHGISHYYKCEGPLHGILYDCVLYFMDFAHYFIMIIVMLFLCGVSVLTAWLLIGMLFIMVRTLFILCTLVLVAQFVLPFMKFLLKENVYSILPNAIPILL